ncbi:MAG TPA: hypothetical protein GX741_01565, partial [Erysipelothrix sp.]|nr:hypothetical protein [Erysipelothrix sp.]
MYELFLKSLDNAYKQVILKVSITEHGKELLYHTASSKLAFLNQKGEIATVGTFITGDDGLVYSNTTYKSYNVFTNYYDESDYQITKWTVSLFGENVSIVYNNGEMDSPEDYFVDMDGIPYIYSYYDDALIEVNGIVEGDYVF